MHTHTIVILLSNTVSVSPYKTSNYDNDSDGAMVEKEYKKSQTNTKFNFLLLAKDMKKGS